MLCDNQKIRIQPYKGNDNSIIQSLIGTAFLGREHEAKKSKQEGGIIDFTGDFNEQALAASGFVFNLVYSADMLWNEDYNNFSWEKVMELAINHMPRVMQLLGDRKQPSQFIGDKDIYPALLISDVETNTIANIGEIADSLIFSHAIENDTSLPEGGIRWVGCYSIHYLDGTKSEIPLVENLNIGRKDIWCGRRLNCATSLYETDMRLQKLCYFTRPEKKVTVDGKLVFIFDFEWINPEPDKVIDRVTLAVDPNEKLFDVCVYNLKIVNSIGG
jgi:hypothetical protein